MADEQTPAADQPEQAAQEDQRESINREKGSVMDTPTTVQEQVEQLDEGTDEHRRRDPLGAAEEQRREE